MQLNNFPPGVVKSPSLTVRYTDKDKNPTGLSSYTFPSMSLGPVLSWRRMVVALIGDCTGTTRASSVTVGGVSLGAHNSAETTYSEDEWVEFWSGYVPSGTSGDVVCTLNSTQDRLAVGMWSVAGRPSAVYDSNEASSNSNVSTLALTVDAPKGGVVIAASNRAKDQSGLTFDELTTDFAETSIDSPPAFQAHAGGSLEVSTPNASLPVVANFVTSDQCAAMVIVFR